MKKLLFLALSLTCFTYAQAQVVFNPKVGVNFSEITSDEVNLAEDGVRAGFNAGVDFRIGGVDNVVFFQPGLHYYNIGSQFRANIEEQEGGDGVDATSTVEDALSVHSLKVPVNVGVYLTGTDGAVHVRLNGGVTPTFILGIGDSDIEVSSDDFNSASWGLNAGLGLDFSVVSLDFGYEHGLSDILTGIDEINAPNVNGRNRIFTVSLGIVLPTN